MFNKVYHGGDYNIEQWLSYDGILEKDIELMKKANINFVSMGIFSWSMLEPTEGNYDFKWLLDVTSKLFENNIKVIMATPSGSKPAWLSSKYKEVQRVNEYFQRELHGNRQSHCMTSPIYREKVKLIDTEIAKRFAGNKNILMWHVSNEFSGHCYCDLCVKKFRDYLKLKYKSIENLNKKWWNTFWSHNFSDFSEIYPPSPIGEFTSTPLLMEWEMFTTLNTIDFYNAERDTIKEFDKDAIVTINFWGDTWMHLDYFEFRKHVDLITYDTYPEWYAKPDHEVAIEASFTYDLMRSLRNDNFFMMESTPSTSNWKYASKLKRPKLHKLSSILPIAFGAQNVGYFQIRKTKGQCEKFHSAVINHDNSDQNFIFKDVCEVGQIIPNLDEILNSKVKNEIALYFDWNNKHALENNCGPLKGKKNGYTENLKEVYKGLKHAGFSTDIVYSESDFSKYKAIIIPMGYSIPDSTWERLLEFSEDNTLITTSMTGYADEIDLIYDNCRNHNFEEISGLKWVEIDGLYPKDENHCNLNGEKILFKDLCELNKVNSCDIISIYEEDFYKGYPVITKNKNSYHIAANTDPDGYAKIFSHIFSKENIKKLKFFSEDLMVSKRENKTFNYYFIMNFNENTKEIDLANGLYYDILNRKYIKNLTLEKYDFAIIRELK